MSPSDFLAVRFTITAVAKLAVFWQPMLALNKHEVQVGFGLGAVYAMERQTDCLKDLRRWSRLQTDDAQLHRHGRVRLPQHDLVSL